MGKVLVIDDDPQVRRAVRRLIEMEGHEVAEAENGKVALRQLANDPADLVITDIYMPEMDGIELLAQLRETLPEARLVAMSGGGVLPAYHMLGAAKALGAIAVIEKPFDIEAVRVHLDALGPSKERP
jgi:DNA-binding NtrC family response regulator